MRGRSGARTSPRRTRQRPRPAAAGPRVTSGRSRRSGCTRPLASVPLSRPARRGALPLHATSAPHAAEGPAWCRGLHTELNPPTRIRQDCARHGRPLLGRLFQGLGGGIARHRVQALSSPASRARHIYATPAVVVAPHAPGTPCPPVRSPTSTVQGEVLDLYAVTCGVDDSPVAERAGQVDVNGAVDGLIEIIDLAADEDDQLYRVSFSSTSTSQTSSPGRRITRS
jgi:hypothetical protein